MTDEFAGFVALRATEAANFLRSIGEFNIAAELGSARSARMDPFPIVWCKAPFLTLCAAGAPPAFRVLGVCSSGKAGGPREVFLRWNELAVRGDPEAAKLICAHPEMQQRFDQPIDRDSAGYPSVVAEGDAEDQTELRVVFFADGSEAVIDFVDPKSPDPDDDEDLYVGLVKERDVWKVCNGEIAAERGIG